MLKEFELGPDAVEYIQACLASGNTLAKELLELPLAMGSVLVHVPEATRQEAVRQFQVGGVATLDETRPHLVSLISSYLRQADGRVAVVESLNLPSDPAVSSSSLPRIIHGSEVYYFLTSEDQNEEDLRRLLAAARLYPFIGILAPTTGNEIRSLGTVQADRTILKELATGAEQILVGAYDEEATLIWVSRKLSVMKCPV